MLLAATRRARVPFRYRPIVAPSLGLEWPGKLLCVAGIVERIDMR